MEMESYLDFNLSYDESNSTSFGRELLIENNLQMFMQELELTIKIMPYELFGLRDSVNTNKYIFNKYISQNRIKQELTSFIVKNCANAIYFDWSIQVRFVKVESKDLLYILFSLDTDGNIITNKFIIGN